jgi:hypothetical protein
MPSRSQWTLATGTPTALPPVAKDDHGPPTCHRARRVPGPSAACPVHQARHARHARFLATRQPHPAAPGRARTTPPAVPGRVQVVRAPDRKARLAPVRVNLPPGRTRPRLPATRPLPALAPLGPIPAGSGSRSRPAQGEIR